MNASQHAAIKQCVTNQREDKGVKVIWLGEHVKHGQPHLPHQQILRILGSNDRRGLEPRMRGDIHHTGNPTC